MSIATDSAPVDKSGGRIRDMFRQVAPRYDLMNHLLSLNIDKWWRRCAVNSLNVQSQLPILDLCTGTGDLALAIDAKYGKQVRVVGSDFCGAMLEIARDKAKQRQSQTTSLQPVEFLEADTQQLPFQDDQFQCVTVAFGLRNVADTDRGLREMTRVCAPGGQVLVLEFSQPTLPGFDSSTVSISRTCCRESAMRSHEMTKKRIAIYSSPWVSSQTASDSPIV